MTIISCLHALAYWWEVVSQMIPIFLPFPVTADLLLYACGGLR